MPGIVWTTANIAVVMVMAIPIVAVVASAWAKSSRTKTLSDLKSRLVEKGMSATEIKTIVEAGEGSSEPESSPG